MQEGLSNVFTARHGLPVVERKCPLQDSSEFAFLAKGISAVSKVN